VGLVLKFLPAFAFDIEARNTLEMQQNIIKNMERFVTKKTFLYLFITGSILSILFYQNCAGFKTTAAPAENNNPAGTIQDGNQNTPNVPGDPAVCSNGLQASCPLESQDKSIPQFQRTDFVTGLNQPWDLTFAPDGTLFFTEKCLGLSVRKTNGQVIRLFGVSGSFLVASDFFCEGQSGMHGVVLHPQYPSVPHVFVFMSSNLSNPRTNRVIRLTVNGDATGVSNRQDIITDLAYKNVGNNWGGAGAHSGGRMRISRSGHLLVTTGDNHNGPLPQSLTQMGGKVLRVDFNGQAVAGNNNIAGADPRIFTLGHRNPQGICLRPGSDQIFTAEHGPGHSDEVNMIRAGGNAGWDPVPAAGVNCADGYCGYISNRPDGQLTSMTDLQKFPQAIQALYTLADSQGMGPCEFFSHPSWKGWYGRMLVGIMAGGRVDMLELNPDGTMRTVQAMNLPNARIRSIAKAFDGSIYMATDNGNIWKLTPQ
jgi:glucose/arabinose dehydrogenase